MNIEQAKGISMPKFLDKLGHKPTKENSREAWYKSPLRNENTASFKVCKKRNVCYDFGIPWGGDIVDFSCRYLKSIGEDHLIPDGLRFINSFVGQGDHFEAIVDRPSVQPEQKLVIKSVDPVKHVSLIRYIERRGISMSIANQYLKQIRLFNRGTNTHLYALGFINEERGYELRNPMFKGSVGKKNITSVKGSNLQSKEIHVFEGFFDFLSALTKLGLSRFKEDAIILNSLSCIKLAPPYLELRNYERLYSWLDNDEAGERATNKLIDFCKNVDGLALVKMNKVYEDFNDVNAWHVAKPGLVRLKP